VVRRPLGDPLPRAEIEARNLTIHLPPKSPAFDPLGSVGAGYQYTSVEPSQESSSLMTPPANVTTGHAPTPRRAMRPIGKLLLL
jgi:hypothetical protein